MQLIGIEIHHAWSITGIAKECVHVLRVLHGCYYGYCAFAEINSRS
jgi:hypothetical protein